MKQALSLCIGLSALLLPAASQAQAPAGWPSKIITIINPATASGAADNFARAYTNYITQMTGWKFILDGKPGAGTTIGTAYVAKAPPDGHTLLAVSGTFTTLPLFYKDLPFDPVKSFAPVTMMTYGSTMLLVHPSMPINNYQDYAAYVRNNPGKLNFGTSGIGSTHHLNGLRLHKSMGGDVTYIPYKGASEVTIALMSGQIKASFGAFSTHLPAVKEGKFRALGVASATRFGAYPELVPLRELCSCDFDHVAWTGIVAPGKTPPAIVNAISTEFIRAGRTPDLVKRLAGGGMEPETSTSTPEVMARFIQREVEKFQRVAAENNLNLVGEQ
jgi:tripartite-type tricarboxylate transporter receptor subunit TctC